MIPSLVLLVSAKDCPIEMFVELVTSVADVPPTRITEAVAEELVKKPLPDSCGLFRLKPPRSSTAPALTTIALVFGMASLAPSLSTPPATVTPAPAKPEAAVTTRMPGPSLISAVPVAVLDSTPDKVPVTPGADTVTVRVVAPRLMAPARLRLLVLAVPPKVKSRLTDTGMALVVRLALPAKIVSGTALAVTLSPMAKVPAVVPSAAALFRISAPSCSIRPVVKVFAAPRTSVPFPAFTICPPAAEMIPVIARSGVTLETIFVVVLITGAALVRLSRPVPLMVATVPALSLAALMALAALRRSTPVATPGRTILGFVLPPLLLKVRLARS